MIKVDIMEAFLTLKSCLTELRVMRIMTYMERTLFVLVYRL
ncbi:hypothetical protein EV146_101454 [Mesobacillus foraminis]|uniref:Uncharacterized protein n=1 Tax=Mesobacillus foraminis TaxID=279826 RepID=A0A4R2BND1_9BACI|nr:hypothetical protein EV146_101454 [Mesobacillus foraminis]